MHLKERKKEEEEEEEEKEKKRRKKKKKILVLGWLPFCYLNVADGHFGSLVRYGSIQKGQKSPSKCATLTPS